MLTSGRMITQYVQAYAVIQPDDNISVMIWPGDNVAPVAWYYIAGWLHSIIIELDDNIAVDVWWYHPAGWLHKCYHLVVW
jgi:hypothetical protein